MLEMKEMDIKTIKTIMRGYVSIEKKNEISYVEKVEWG
jgi:hypothetical protein